MKTSTFRNDVSGVLQRKGYKEHCYTLDKFLGIVEDNCGFAATKVCCYKWGGFFLLTAIPLISAVLSTSIGLAEEGLDWLSSWLRHIVLPLSLALTIFTILNSIFKPSERFGEACRLKIGLDGFEAKFLADLERQKEIKERFLLDLIDEKRAEFEVYQMKLIGLFLPSSKEEGVGGLGTTGKK